MNDDLFRLEKVSLCSGYTTRLDYFSLSIPQWEITGIVGPSSSGKSSLCRLLTGGGDYNGGTVYYRGAVLTGRRVPAAAAARIMLISSASRLPAQFTAAELLSTIDPARGRRIFFDRRTIRTRAAAVLAALQIPIRPEASIRELSLAQQHLLLLAGAYLKQAELVILNNVVSGYTDQEWALVRQTLERIRAGGVAVLLTSSRESRLTELCSSITVLQGRTNLKTFLPAEYPALRRGLHYRQEYFSSAQAKSVGTARSGPPLFSASRLSTPALRTGAFDLYPGEIVGIFDANNLAGQELFSALTRMDPACGQYRLEGKPLPPMGYTGCMRRGIGFMADDPASRECFPYLSALDNILCASRKNLGPTFYFRRRLRRHLAAHYAEQLGFSPSQMNAALDRFGILDRLRISLCRWELVDLKVLFCSRLLENADLEGKLVLEDALRSAAAKGAAVVVFGYDWSNMLEICDDIYIIDDGRMGKRLSREEALLPFLRDGHGQDVKNRHFS